MMSPEQILGPIVEAWGEVKAQKARVILSLVGVVAAVAAMSTVIALGDLVLQSSREMMDAEMGRSVTLHVSASKESEGEGEGSEEPVSEHGYGGSGSSNPMNAASPDPRGQGQNPQGQGQNEDANVSPGGVSDPMGEAMETLASRFEIPYWSRFEKGNASFEEVWKAEESGQFRGYPTIKNRLEGNGEISVYAVDPSYSTIFRLQPSHGRWIEEADADQRLVPVVINSILWNSLGRAPIEDPIILTSDDEAKTRYRVVGVIDASSQWDEAKMYVDYRAWQFVKLGGPNSSGAGSSARPSVEMLVWSGEEQAEEAREVLPDALAAILGKGWKGSVYGGEKVETGESALQTAQTVVMIVGGIVILLGALGLLNVAIVTVRQRIREIGIRRAMGASAKRVFFAVFMESVVATFVAGVIGVGLAIVIVRFLPLESLDIVLQGKPAFPVNAAISGVAISTAIGALCGIIPAFAAVRVKPIDAIRY